jgi:hypothetical protein
VTESVTALTDARGPASAKSSGSREARDGAGFLLPHLEVPPTKAKPTFAPVPIKGNALLIVRLYARLFSFNHQSTHERQPTLADTHIRFSPSTVFLVNVPIELVAIAATLLAIVGRDTQRANCCPPRLRSHALGATVLAKGAEP